MNPQHWNLKASSGRCSSGKERLQVVEFKRFQPTTLVANIREAILPPFYALAGWVSLEKRTKSAVKNAGNAFIIPAHPFQTLELISVFRRCHIRPLPRGSCTAESSRLLSPISSFYRSPVLSCFQHRFDFFLYDRIHYRVTLVIRMYPVYGVFLDHASLLIDHPGVVVDIRNVVLFAVRFDH